MKITSFTRYTCLEGVPENISIEVCNDSKENSVAFNVSDLVPFYYLGNKSENNPVNRKDQAFKPVEVAVNEIKTKEKWTPKDVYRILAWKMGKIKHINLEDKYKDKKDISNYTSEPIFEYDQGWSQDDSDESRLKIQFRNSHELDEKQFGLFANAVIELHDCYVNKSKDSIQIWKDLLALATDKKIDLNGLGTVYLITLLHFITQGEKPIVDRFVLAALAVKQLLDEGYNIPKNSIIRGCSLPSKTEKAAKELMNPDSVYGKYCALLRKQFPNENEDLKDREVDQALWVYGHYFKVI